MLLLTFDRGARCEGLDLYLPGESMAFVQVPLGTGLKHGDGR